MKGCHWDPSRSGCSMKMLLLLITFQWQYKWQKIMRIFTQKTNVNWHFQVYQISIGNGQSSFHPYWPAGLLQRFPTGNSNHVLLSRSERFKPFCFPPCTSQHHSCIHLHWSSVVHRTWLPKNPKQTHGKGNSAANAKAMCVFLKHHKNWQHVGFYLCFPAPPKKVLCCRTVGG